jgi:hypothetical protein
MSITVPTISRITLIASRNTIFDSTWDWVHVTSLPGTWSVTMKLVSAVDAKMMMKIAPTIASASRLTLHSTRGASGWPQPIPSRTSSRATPISSTMV